MYTQLLFYDRPNGIGTFYGTDGKGGLTYIRGHSSWLQTWDMIVPGEFGGSKQIDLLFYDKENGIGALDMVDSKGEHSKLNMYFTWLESWNQIIPGQFGGNGYCDLLFYERESSMVTFFQTDGKGNFYLLNEDPVLLPDCDLIIPRDFQNVPKHKFYFWTLAFKEGLTLKFSSRFFAHLRRFSSLIGEF